MSDHSAALAQRITLVWRIQTDNFDSWLNPDPDGLVEMFRPQGVLSFSVHRGADDPNTATIQMQFADRAAVEAFETWYVAAKIEWMKQFPGTAHTTVDRWLGHEVPSHTRQLG